MAIEYDKPKEEIKQSELEEEGSVFEPTKWDIERGADFEKTTQQTKNKEEEEEKNVMLKDYKNYKITDFNEITEIEHDRLDDFLTHLLKNQDNLSPANMKVFKKINDDYKIFFNDKKRPWTSQYKLIAFRVLKEIYKKTNDEKIELYKH